jgi:hypothetical protein
MIGQGGSGEVMQSLSKKINMPANTGVRIVSTGGKFYLAVDRVFTLDGFELNDAEASQLRGIFDRLGGQTLTRDIGGALDANPWGCSGETIAAARGS